MTSRRPGPWGPCAPPVAAAHARRLEERYARKWERAERRLEEKAERIERMTERVHQRAPGARAPRPPGPPVRHRPEPDRARRGIRRGVAGVLFVLMGAAFLLESVGVWAVQLVYLWPLCLVALGTWVLFGRSALRKVEANRSQQLALAEERVRIARELHDIVAHSVSLMTIQIAAARRVQAKKPAEADKALGAAEEIGRESLAELRRIVSVLRSADASIEAANLRSQSRGEDGAELRPLPGLDDLTALAESTREAGLDVTLHEIGMRPTVPPAVGLAAYRVVQEALTNVIRHAPEATVSVTVTYRPDAVEVLVDDDGQGADPTRTSPGTGNGLIGMRERVEAVGGTIAVGPKLWGSGWEVDARIPTDR